MTAAMTKAEADELIERVRRCMAEAGYIDRVDGLLTTRFVSPEVGYALYWMYGSRRPSLDLLWRAREISVLGQPICFRHYEQNERFNQLHDCVADRRFIKDCGG